jgi:hypothetical protein
MPTKDVISKRTRGAIYSFIVVMVPLFLGSAHAATKCVFFDKFKDNNDGTVTDPRNGLVWKRFAEGFCKMFGLFAAVARVRPAWPRMN